MASMLRMRPQSLASVVMLFTPFGVPLVKQLGSVTPRGVPNTAPYFKFPAGHAEKGEDAHQVASREADEETGIAFDHSILKKVFEEERGYARRHRRALFIGKIDRIEDMRVWEQEQGLERLFRPFTSVDAFAQHEDFLPDHRLLITREEVRRAIADLLRS